ncbi:hypothetical protein BDB13_3932 [Rhodococcus sp. OK302]|nr:hypothetical protein BDB13_3932 [Rhodococcus sp. OK302]
MNCIRPLHHACRMTRTGIAPVSCIHRWEAESRHRTSEGTVTYLRCHCGSWQTLLTEGLSGSAGSAITAPIKARSRA